MNSSELLKLGFTLPEPEIRTVIEERKTSEISKWFMAAWIVVPIVVSGMGIGATVRTMEQAIAQSDVPIVEPEVTERSQSEIVTPRTTSEPKILKLTVNVSTPDDLKVKQGDELVKDTVIADRDLERNRLAVQKNGLVNSIARLNIESIPPLPPRPVAKPIRLPSITYAEELAQINNQLLRVKEAEEKISLQQRKIDVVGGLEESELPKAVIFHEQQKLVQLQAELEKVKSELQLSEGKYQGAKDRRAYEEYRYSETIARFEQEQNQIKASYERSLAEYRKQEQERTFQIATLDGKMAEVENQLKTLTTVRSPYNAVVKRIKLAGQADNRLTYDLVLAINSDRPDKK